MLVCENVMVAWPGHIPIISEIAGERYRIIAKFSTLGLFLGRASSTPSAISVFDFSFPNGN